MDQPKRSIRLDTTARVSDPICRARLKIAASNIGISDREWPTEIQNMLMQLDHENVEIWTQPERMPVPLIDDVWKSERYVRDFLASETCEYPERDRWLLLYFKVMMPRIYQHIVR
ncbi:hypothetical protein [Cognatiyoonia sp. IB215182]|uniref:hypothetical protein n=1 Tax=Cognatiyoonia sp. IB215182 TaxID=3097353 RepID=UPI002A11CAAE|nr:hypothetical protein [Cognatiyoonia sp. IB215182]MDX8353973.1 hypothetical protein [Cognatiyoonia sp. IB215182]